jgi:23S rRNA (adenine2503-C2)-methyltransferase
MMKIVSRTGTESLAMVYIGEFSDGRQVEFVESTQPPYTRDDKWVLIISTLFGCPVGCVMCDAGGKFQGKLTKEQMLAQIDFLVMNRLNTRNISIPKFKIQFSRMGEPAFNHEVLDVLEALPELYEAPGLIPSFSTVAPIAREAVFDRLLEIKNRFYSNGHFQMQFSIHSTDSKQRQQIIPIRTWSFKEIASYGEQFYQPGDRKITLNFALAEGFEFNPSVIQEYFDPKRFLLKITPINPTFRAEYNHLKNSVTHPQDWIHADATEVLTQAGYNVLISIGELEENQIGSNCGQVINEYKRQRQSLVNAYTYDEQTLSK